MNPKFRHRVLWPAAFAAWLVLLWCLSSGPVSMPDGPMLPHFDKFCHFAYFASGGFLATRCLAPNRRLSPRLALLVAIALLAAIGWLDEWHQSFVPGRSGNDLGDWIADLTGAVAGSWFMQPKRPRPPHPPDSLFS